MKRRDPKRDELVGRVFEQEQLVRELLRIAAMCRRGGDA